MKKEKQKAAISQPISERDVIVKAAINKLTELGFEANEESIFLEPKQSEKFSAMLRASMNGSDRDKAMRKLLSIINRIKIIRAVKKRK